ncbi:ABC transporter permease [uncultured Roseovarius sp.]|uniref:ABC transporter permease n=1 Tax=uncultured Roseovarius sp. TaxID=293344 RepID=UPI0026145B72|nr:ABC transporter permease [uncultured Roseovarius sp.]
MSQSSTPNATPRASRKTSVIAGVVRRLLQDRRMVVLLSCLAVLLFVAVFAPWLSPHNPDDAVAATPNMPLWSEGLLLGSDNQARDLLSRTLAGARISLFVSIVPTLAATVLSVLIGLFAGYAGGRVDAALMAVLDIFFAFPIVLLAIAVAGVMGPGLLTIIVSIFVVLLPYITRVARTSTQQVLSRPYIEAARSAGATSHDIMWRYILPNMIGPVIVYVTTLIGLMVVVASGLSFLGLGVQPPTADWGAMVAEGAGVLRRSPHVTFVPGVMIVLTALLFNLIGDRLRDIFDPRSAG